MAESRSPNNSGMAPSSSAAAPADWEVLTMSMSSSALGKPHGDDLDNASAKHDSQIESSSDPLLNASDVWTDPLHASTNQDSSNDAEAEPFTEGWKPNLSASSGLYGFGGENDRHEEPLLSREGAETYFDSNASMSIPEGLFVSEKDDGGVEKRVLAYNQSADDGNIDDEVVKEKIKGKGRKQPKKSSKVVWSIAVAATVVGIVFLGHRLHLAYNQNQQLQIQISAKDEKLNELLLQVDRLKEVLGNHHQRKY